MFSKIKGLTMRPLQPQPGARLKQNKPCEDSDRDAIQCLDRNETDTCSQKRLSSEFPSMSVLYSAYGDSLDLKLYGNMDCDALFSMFNELIFVMKRFGAFKVLFSDDEILEPTVMVPYDTKVGEVPRKVQVERRVLDKFPLA
eukprot:Gb_31261 [translate_table: standard]